MDAAMMAERAGPQEVVGAPGMTKAEAERLWAVHSATTRQEEEDWRQRAVKFSDGGDEDDQMKEEEEEESPTYPVQAAPHTQHAPSAPAMHDGATELMQEEPHYGDEPYDLGTTTTRPPNTTPGEQYLSHTIHPTSGHTREQFAL